MTLSDAAPEILIIDDTPSNLSVVANLFEDRGYRVSIAQDGAEGMQRARLLHPDLILLDVMMPGTDGFAVCAQLKADPTLCDIPVIFMTALASVEHKVKGFRAGAVDYVTKPLQIDEVMARVDTHLKLHAAQNKLAQQNEELERRVAERTAELAAREREFRTLVENAPDDIARHDRRGRFFYINPQHEKTLGVALDNLIGKTPLECFPGIPDVEAYQAQLMAVIETGRTQEYGVTMPDTGDGPRYHSVLLVAERGEDGEIVGVLAIGRDITERKRAERELLLLNQAVNASSEAVFLMDAQGRFVYVNEEACRSLGLSHEELLGMTPLDIDADLTVEAFRRMLDSISAGSLNKTPMESRHRSRDGRVFPIEIVGSPIQLEGQSYGLAMVRDVSERKRAERLLHEREQAILAMVENSPDTIVRYDSQCRRIYLNPAMAKVFGRPRDELLGTSPSQSSPLPPAYLTAIRTVLETGVEQRMESSFRQADDSVHWVDLRLAPEFDAEGKVATVLAIGRDITERKFAEQALAASEREFRTLVENVPDNIARHDLQGRYVYFNQQLEKTLGKPVAVLFGKTPLELLPGSADARAYLDCILAVAQTGISREYEATLPDMGEGQRYHSIQLVAERDAENNVIGVLTLGRDITERKRAERLLHEKDEAIRAVVENSPDAHARYDRQFRRLYVNPATERLLGLPQEKIIGKTPVAGAVLPPEFIDLLESVFQSGKEVRTEMPFRWPNGEQGWGDVRIVPEFGPDGSVATVLSIGRDITERKRIEDLLREERGLFVGGPTVVFKWKAQEGWPVEYVSPNVLDQFGYAPEQFTDGEIIFGSIVHPEDIERVTNEVITYTAQGRTSYEQEYRIAHANGEYRWIYDFTIVSRKEDGAVDHYHGYVMDITARKVIETALKQSEQRYRLVFENSPISIWEEDFSGVKAQFDVLRNSGVVDIEAHFDEHPEALARCVELTRIVNINQAAVALHEAASKEELFAGLVNTFAPESFDAFRGELIGLWNGVLSMSIDTVVRTLAGERRNVNVHFTVCPGYENSLGKVLVSLVDITERKRAEELLDESRKQLRGLTAQREAAREEERKYIAREVHDELGQILTGLKLNVSLLEHQLTREEGVVRDSLKEVSALTDRSLEVARNVATALRPAALDMGIASALEWLAGRFSQNTGIQCIAKTEGGEFELPEEYAIALFRIVQESLTNVARHAQASRIEITITRQQGDYILKVRDNGKGFDTSRKKLDSFGLVGMKERAFMLGGELSIESSPGKGTQLMVRIPQREIGEGT